MLFHFGRYAALALFFGSGIWIGLDHGQTEPYLAAGSMLVALLVFDRYFFRSKTHRAADRILFNSFLELLPSGELIDFLMNHDMSAGFSRDRLANVVKFKIEWNNAESEFLDPVLESHRQMLRTEVVEFWEAVDEYIDEPQPNWWRVSQQIRDGDAEIYAQAVAELHDLATRVAQAHQSLIREARKRLGAEDPE